MLAANRNGSCGTTATTDTFWAASVSLAATGAAVLVAEDGGEHLLMHTLGEVLADRVPEHLLHRVEQQRCGGHADEQVAVLGDLSRFM